ncbi:3-methyladenine DNA glycosylase AlkD [Anaerocolumna jejuensis DSM 15929]|uniref:3-methyladenine DNA glycosylase AlkD n=1 Tax=Anaerocolumna jejuensis DSM 15929 TaxID=1121322 RepID=A0A1M6Q5N8_9FIRM|nr:DNA alkylation repair protein [Anaerocolumna jejuensis]SHK15579.1 3-methyladenine DNA glycosylase AlkD [Anaerocolumna jejuensis DSM 15929]
MDVQTVLQELELLGSERTKKVYMQQGAQEPLFGVATGAMKPIFKKIRNNQALANELYATGNYDAMYLAGMIADPKVMTEADFNRWMVGAYFYMISDFIVAVTLAETDFAQAVSDRWIASGKELYVSAGYSCYCWLLGSRRDEEFDREKLNTMLETVEKTIHSSPDRARYAMNNFVTTVGISYVPLHEKAISAAKNIGTVDVFRGKIKCSVPLAADEIQKAVDKGRIGFKRKNVRC